jgi:hypothetical protein
LALQLRCTQTNGQDSIIEKKKKGMSCHDVALPFTLKSKYLKAKEEL